MRLICFLLFLLSWSRGISQNDPFAGVRTLSTIPISPEAFAMSKYGDVPIGTFTGTAQFQLPLFSLSGSGIGINVGLNYSTNGIKVDEVSSRVGMGWNLNTGGVVTRKVLGLPDGHPTAFSNQPSSHDVNSAAFYNYLQTSTQSGADSQYDEFSYNFNGYSGSFIIKNGIVKEIQRSALKIAVQINLAKFIFTFTTPDGVKYVFGENFSYDESESYNWDAPSTERHQQIRSPNAWYLSKIINANRSDSIVLKYDYLSGGSNVDYFTGVTQEYIYFPYFNPVYIAGNAIGGVPTNSCYEQSVVQTNFSKAKLFPCFLKEIIGLQGRIRLFYSNRDDVVGERKIDSIALYKADSVSLVKKYALTHIYSNASSSLFNTPIQGLYYYPHENLQSLFPELNKRLFLESVKEIGVDGAENPPFTFQYDSINQLPPRLSFSQDYAGYFNARQNGLFFPDVTNWSYGLTGYGADRRFDDNAMKKGVLTKVIYPTSGETRFTYEPNKTWANYYNRATFVNSSVSGSLINSTVSYKQSTTPFSLLPNTSMVLNAECLWAGNPADSMTLRGDESVSFSILRLSDSTYILDQHSLEINESYSRDFGVPMESGDYLLIIKTNYLKMTGYATLNLRQRVPLPPGNESSGGIRVKKIMDYENGKFAKGKEFSYNLPEDTLKSSESLMNIDYVVDNHIQIGRKLGSLVPSQSLSGYCYYNVFSSSGFMNLYLSDYVTAGYKHVVEYSVDSSGNRTGGTENEFLIKKKAVSQPLSFSFPTDIWGHAPYLIPGAVPTNDDYLNGTQIYAGTFLLNSGVKKMMNKQNFYYSLDSRQYEVDTLYTVRKPLNRDSHVIEWMYFFDYDVNRYYRHHYWTHLDSVVKRSYNQDNHDSIIVKETYGYQNTQNYLKTDFAMHYSPQNIASEQYFYPTTYFSNPVYASMVNMNKVGDVVLKKSFKNEVLQYEDQTDYQYFNGDPLLILPFQRKVQKAGESINSMLKFNEYDTKGNLLSFSANDDIKTSLVLNDLGERIAVCPNASPNEIFFDSFEEAGTWDDVVYDEVRHRGGLKSVKFSNPNTSEMVRHSTKWLNVSNSSPKKYRYSVWYYSDGPQAELFLFMKSPGETGYYTNSVSSSLTGKWVLLQGEFEVPSNITQLNIRLDNNGQGNIWFDDVRLHPSDAQMTSYTYVPLIGMKSSDDANQKITYYEYDSFSRLTLVRDENSNIIKRICYNYAGQPEPCKIYGNQAKSQVFTRNNCLSGSIPGTYTYSVAANQFYAESQLAADALAQADINSNGQNTANANAACTYGNVVKTGTFTRNNCNVGEVGSTVTYTVAANTYSSTVSQAAADALAQADVDANGQTYANSNGTCTVACVPRNCRFEGQKCVNNNCEWGVKVYTSAVQNPSTLMWTCTYHYEFSDGSWSANYSEVSARQCDLPL